MVYQEFTQEEAKELGAFVEDAISENDILDSTLYPYGNFYAENYPTKWDTFYNKWFSLDLSRTGGFPSVSLMALFVLTSPFTLSKIWIIDPLLKKLRR
jgi:hypothetical protein